MSEKRMAASKSYLRMGCIVHSATSLGSSSSFWGEITLRYTPRMMISGQLGSHLKKVAAPNAFVLVVLGQMTSCWR